jgi:hypothetical protein
MIEFAPKREMSREKKDGFTVPVHNKEMKLIGYYEDYSNYVKRLHDYYNKKGMILK